MSACWMIMILVGCRLSHATHSQNSCVCNEQLKPVCVPVGNNVSVPCPNMTGEDVTFNLLRGEVSIVNHTCNHQGDARNCKQYWMDVALLKKTEDKSVSFMLTGVNANSHGIYRCEGTVVYPPPLKTERSLRILVLVEGHQCNKVCSNVKTDELNCGFHCIWIIVLVSIYSIVVTVITIVIWVKLRRTDSQSDYMNTKPKPPRDRRKKRGVQNPIPRHF